MQKGDRHRWLWVMLLLSYKSLMVKGSQCYCRLYHDCAYTDFPANTQKIVSISRVNVALGKPCSQSSTWSDAPNLPNCGNDGDLQLEFEIYKPFCVHTNDWDYNPSYFIDLLVAYPVNHIVIYWRTGYKHRHVHTRVLLDGNLCYKFDSQNDINHPNTVRCYSPMRGKFFKLEKRSADIAYLGNEGRTMNVCEVQVWACWPGSWGSDCQFVCDDPICGDRKPCNPFTGKCEIPAERDFGAQGPVTEKEVQVKTTRPPPPKPGIFIRVPTEASTTTTIKPPEECLNWIYAICLIVVSILITVGIYLSLTYSKGAQGAQGAQGGQDLRQSISQAENQGEVEDQGEVENQDEVENQE